MITARRFDVGAAAFNDLSSLEDYADSTSGNVMRIAARVLDDRVPDYALLRLAGMAYALAGLLRAMPMHAARGKSFLPQSLVKATGEKNTIATVAKTALGHHAAARSRPKSGRFLPAALPATLVPLYATRLSRMRRRICRARSRRSRNTEDNGRCCGRRSEAGSESFVAFLAQRTQWLRSGRSGPLREARPNYSFRRQRKPCALTRPKIPRVHCATTASSALKIATQPPGANVRAIGRDRRGLDGRGLFCGLCRGRRFRGTIRS